MVASKSCSTVLADSGWVVRMAYIILHELMQAGRILYPAWASPKSFSSANFATVGTRRFPLRYELQKSLSPMGAPETKKIK